MKIDNKSANTKYQIPYTTCPKNFKNVNYYAKLAISDKVSFSGASKLSSFEKVIIKVQRKVFNGTSYISNGLNKKIFTLINIVERKKTFPSGKVDAERYCNCAKSLLVAPVTLYSKADKTPVTGYVSIRKINPDVDYSKLISTCASGDIVNALIQNRVKCTKKGESVLSKAFGFPEGHMKLTENSCLIEVLDNYGFPIGMHFLDINKDKIVSKGVVNHEPDAFAGVGRVLNDVKSLIAHLNGSKKVTMPTTDAAKAFHIKCGYRTDSSKKECGAGEWLHLPEQQLSEIVNKYKGSELYSGLSEAIKKLGLV